MPKITQAKDSRVSRSGKRNVKLPRATSTAGDHTAAAGIPSISADTFDDHLYSQTDRLGDSRLSSVQRQSLAAQIERVQGNQHLQKALGTKKKNNTSLDLIVQRSLQEFDRRRQQAGIAPGFPIQPLPASREERREGALYYDDSDADLEAMCVRDASAERWTVQGVDSYIVGYQSYKIYFIFGRGAVQRRGGGRPMDVPGESLLAMYRHEREHQCQYQALRRVDRQIARQNRVLYERIGPLSSAATIRGIAAQMVPIDPEIWRRQTRSEHLTSVRSVRTRQIPGMGGMDLTSQANREVAAHTTAFAQSIRASVSAAVEQICPLCAVVPQIGTTPRWSYDMADQNIRDTAIRRVLGSTWRTRDPITIFNGQIIPALEAVESNERTLRRVPTSFLRDLRAACRANPGGQLEPDPATALLYLRGG